jgi:hypothetical protein
LRTGRTAARRADGDLGRRLDRRRRRHGFVFPTRSFDRFDLGIGRTTS